MPQIFVSYARADKRQVAKLIKALRTLGFEAWWDDDIPAGAAWEQTIERQLNEADAVVVCWSAVSVASENVRSEARVARAENRLVQIFLDDSKPPLFFGERQGIDLRGWNGSIRQPQAARLKEALDAALDGRTADVPAGKPSRAWNRRKFGTALRSVGTLAILLAAAGIWWQHTPKAAPGAARVALDPIRATGGAAAATAAATDLTDQIATALTAAHIPTVSRDDAGASAAGGSDYTVYGTVEKLGTELHARIHLDDRRQRLSLWSYEATAPATDPRQFEYRVGQAIAGVLSCAYRGLGGGLTDNDLLSRYVRVCDLFVNHDDASDTKSTFELLNNLRLITQKAPDFVPAKTDFAKFGAYLAPLLLPDQAAPIRAEAAEQATRALQLDPKASDAWLARAMLLRPTDWAQREQLLRKAVAVNPEWPHSNGFLAQFLMETGRMREATAYGQRAAAADLQIDWRPFAARMACEAGQADATITDLQDELANAPGDEALRYALVQCLQDARRYKDALEAVDTKNASAGSRLNQAVEKALISGQAADREAAETIAADLAARPEMLPNVIQAYAQLGDMDRAFASAEQYRPGYPMTGIVMFLFGPRTEAMRRDPRFLPLMQKYGLLQFWQATGRWPDFCAGDSRARCRKAAAS